VRLIHTSTQDDKTLAECASFGGVAADAVVIAERLDSIIEAKENECSACGLMASALQTTFLLNNNAF
jgi:hypothetical protein